MIDDETVDPDDLAPDADEEGDELDPELEDLKTKQRGKDKEEVLDDEVDTPDRPRTTDERRAAQS